MINITFYTKGSRLTGVKSEGHANYAEHGKDIVCAAVSAVLIGIANEVSRYEKISHRISDGLIEIKAGKDEAVGVLMRFAFHALQEIAESYPDNVKVTIKENQ